MTVTYGDRYKLLRQVVEGALANGVAKIVVVDNGSADESTWAIRDLEFASGGRVVVVAMPGNLGSAAGFKAGLEKAVRCSDCEFIWLLDDDNKPGDGALDALLKHYAELSDNTAVERLALTSMRREWDQHRKVALGVPVRKVFPRHSSFIGFHLLIPPRIVSWLLSLDRVKPGICPSAIEIPLAPYGGLFFHKTVISKLGYPNESFFLYNDDTEYTHRFTSTGGRLFLVPSSVVDDLELSWHLLGEGETFVSHFLLADSDWRIYYAIRNQSYVSRHYWCRNFLIYSLNKAAFFSLLGLYALGHWKWQRFALIARAVREGELGELGRSVDFETSTEAR